MYHAVAFSVLWVLQLHSPDLLPAESPIKKYCPIHGSPKIGYLVCLIFMPPVCHFRILLQAFLLRIRKDALPRLKEMSSIHQVAGKQVFTIRHRFLGCMIPIDRDSLKETVNKFLTVILQSLLHHIFQIRTEISYLLVKQVLLLHFSG